VSGIAIPGGIFVLILYSAADAEPEGCGTMQRMARSVARIIEAAKIVRRFRFLISLSSYQIFSY